MEQMENKDKECLFGITHFFDATAKGFNGTLKNRISDFLVNEVDLDGNIVHLTQIEVQEQLFQTAEPATVSRLDNEIKMQIEKFIESGQISMEISAPEDKDARRLLHKHIESVFPQLLRNPKQSANGSRSIEITIGSKQSGLARHQQATRNRYSSMDYIHCVLYKENMDTMEAVNHLGKFLRVPPQCIQYAGVKDKRAKTSQKISIRLRDPRRIVEFSHPAIRIGNYSFEKAPLRLGDLTGNRFQLVIRNLVDAEDAIEGRTKSFSAGGFINYYGLQRFGTTEISTVEVGKALLRSDWNSFVDLIMKPRQGDNPTVARCRQIWDETKDAAKALQALGHRNCVESYLLKGLTKQHTNNVTGAIQNIPRNMRLLYVHSFQSYLWNMAASYRLKKFGVKPMVGDLVYKQDGGEQESKRVKREQIPSDQVIRLSENDLSNFSIYDVLLPLPGFDVQFPDNEVTKYIMDLMGADDIDLRQRHPIKDYSLPGSYRPVVSKPLDFSWELKKNLSHINQDVLLSDADLLDGKTLSDVEKAGSAMVLVIRLTLRSSVYATMAIRELLKRSSDFHAPASFSSDTKAMDKPETEENITEAHCTISE